jgi:hypothetical protein
MTDVRESIDRRDSDISEVEESDESLSGNNPSNANAIMNLFSAYYGIEDPSANAAGSGKGTIDDANFGAEEYVKDLLLNESMEGLIVKDAEMVHEIRVSYVSFS